MSGLLFAILLTAEIFGCTALLAWAFAGSVKNYEGYHLGGGFFVSLCAFYWGLSAPYPFPYDSMGEFFMWAHISAWSVVLATLAIAFVYHKIIRPFVGQA